MGGLGDESKRNIVSREAKSIGSDKPHTVKSSHSFGHKKTALSVPRISEL